MSSPRSPNGKAFAKVRALDAILKSAPPSECIMLIPEADNWVPNIEKEK